MSTINQQIETIINDKLEKDIAYPTQVEIIKIYTNDKKKYDITSTEYGTLKNIDSITEHEIGDKTILIFLNNNYNERIII